MKIASKAEDILGVKYIRYEDLEIPEWNTTVRIRGMTAAARDAWMGDMMAQQKANGGLPNLTNIRARFVAHTLIDENGTRLLSVADAAQLGEQDSNVIERIYKKARELNGIGEDQVAGSENNSGPSPSDSSHTA